MPVSADPLSGSTRTRLLSVQNKILAKVEDTSGGWVGNTYGSEGIIGIGAGPSEQECVASPRETATTTWPRMARIGSREWATLDHRTYSSVRKAP